MTHQQLPTRARSVRGAVDHPPLPGGGGGPIHRGRPWPVLPPVDRRPGKPARGRALLPPVERPRQPSGRGSPPGTGSSRAARGGRRRRPKAATPPTPLIRRKVEGRCFRCRRPGEFDGQPETGGCFQRRSQVCGAPRRPLLATGRQVMPTSRSPNPQGRPRGACPAGSVPPLPGRGIPENTTTTAGGRQPDNSSGARAASGPTTNRSGTSPSTRPPTTENAPGSDCGAPATATRGFGGADSSGFSFQAGQPSRRRPGAGPQSMPSARSGGRRGERIRLARRRIFSTGEVPATLAERFSPVVVPTLRRVAPAPVRSSTVSHGWGDPRRPPPQRCGGGGHQGGAAQRTSTAPGPGADRAPIERPPGEPRPGGEDDPDGGEGTRSMSLVRSLINTRGSPSNRRRSHTASGWMAGTVSDTTRS